MTNREERAVAPKFLEASLLTLAGCAAIGLFFVLFHTYDRNKRKLPTWDNFEEK